MPVTAVPLLFCLQIAVVEAGVDARKAYTDAAADFRAGRYRKAAAGFRSTLADPAFAAEHPEALYHAGRAFLLSGDYSEARRLLLRAEELVADLSLRKRIPYWRAWAEFGLGNCGAALALLQEHPVPPAYRKEAAVLSARCIAAEEDFNPELLLQTVREAASLGAGPDELAALLIDASGRLGYPASAGLLEAASKDLPAASGQLIRQNILFLAVQAGDLNRAAEMLEEGAVAPSPLLSALLSLKAGRFDEAVERFRTAASSGDHDPRLLTAVGAHLYASMPAPQEAFRDLPEDVLKKILPGAARLLHSRGRTAETFIALDQAGRLGTLDRTAFWLAAVSASRTGRSMEAARYFFQYAHQYPEASNAAEALYRAAWLLDKSGCTEDAQKLLKKLRMRYPGSRWARSLEQDASGPAPPSQLRQASE